MSKRPSMRKMLEKKEKQAGKEDMLEKNDFKALMIAAFSVFGPILIAAIVLLAIFIIVWTWIF